MDKYNKKRESEKKVVEEMIRIYCRGQHGVKDLCPLCQELLNYCNERTDKCPRMESKTFCSKCDNPCYKPEMRNRIKEVMRYSGKRILFRHPILTVKHFILK